MKVVSTLKGIDSIAVDMKEQKLTVIGTVDPITVVSKPRKLWHAEIFSVDPAKEPEKKDEAKKEDPKKEEGEKKDESKKEEGDKKKELTPNDQIIADLVKAYKAYNPQMTTHYYVQSAEENPNSCVIC